MFIDIEKWQEIFNTLRRHKLRTALTAFGVFWGIFMLTVLLGAGKGLENGVNDGFPRVTNTVYLWSQGPTQIPWQGMPIGRQIALKPSDVDAIAKNVPSVGFIKGQNSVGIWGGSAPYTVRKSRNGAFSVQGAFAGVENFNALRIVAGRPFNELDEQERRKVALIGQRVKDQLFAKDENPLGEDITVNGITFQVIGVFQSLQEGNQQQEDERIYLPNDTLRYAFNQTGVIGSLAFVPKAGLHAKRGGKRRQGLSRPVEQGVPGRPGACSAASTSRNSTTRCRACSRASSSSAGWSRSAPSLRVPWAWATSC